jgi:hypothetical protein
MTDGNSIVRMTVEEFEHELTSIAPTDVKAFIDLYRRSGWAQSRIAGGDDPD